MVVFIGLNVVFWLVVAGLTIADLKENLKTASPVAALRCTADWWFSGRGFADSNFASAVFFYVVFVLGNGLMAIGIETYGATAFTCETEVGRGGAYHEC